MHKKKKYVAGKRYTIYYERNLHKNCEQIAQAQACSHTICVSVCCSVCTRMHNEKCGGPGGGDRKMGWHDDEKRGEPGSCDFRDISIQFRKTKTKWNMCLYLSFIISMVVVVAAAIVAATIIVVISVVVAVVVIGGSGALCFILLRTQYINVLCRYRDSRTYLLIYFYLFLSVAVA